MDNPYSPTSASSMNYYQSVSTFPATSIWSAGNTNGTTLTFYPTTISGTSLPEPKRSGSEDPIEWLRRRVREIEWREAA